MNSIDEIYEKLGYAFKNILTDDIVKTGWTKIKVRYDITWDGESESYIYWDPDGNIHSFRELFDGIFGEKFKLYKKRQEEYGITVLRFSNVEVDRHFESVCGLIDNTVRTLIKN